MRLDPRIIEALDRKYGRVTIEHWKRIGEKSPLELGPDDLDIIEMFEGDEGRARTLARIADARSAPIIRKKTDTLATEKKRQAKPVTFKQLATIITAIGERLDLIDQHLDAIAARPVLVVARRL